MGTNWQLEMSSEGIGEGLSSARGNLHEAQRCVERGDVWGASGQLGGAMSRVAQVIQDVNAASGADGGYVVEPGKASVKGEAGYNPTKPIYRSLVELELAESALAEPGTSTKAAVYHLAAAMASMADALVDYHVNFPKLRKPILGRW